MSHGMLPKLTTIPGTVGSPPGSPMLAPWMETYCPPANEPLMRTAAKFLGEKKATIVLSHNSDACAHLEGSIRSTRGCALARDTNQAASTAF